MNYIKHLAGFFERVANDERLNPTHISMYVSLFQFWNASRFKNPISISRGELMKISKISSKATYHKCMRELNQYGYLQYKPSYNPFKGSLVYLFDFQASPEQAVIRHHTKKETSPEQALEPYINNTNSLNINNENIAEQPGNGKKKAPAKRKEKSSAKKEKKPDASCREPGTIIPPPHQEVIQFFTSQDCPVLEADKFYNYFSSNGWLVGGKSRMKDWQAAARNWIINSKTFRNEESRSPHQSRAGNLHSANDKNYSEPL